MKARVDYIITMTSLALRGTDWPGRSISLLASSLHKYEPRKIGFNFVVGTLAYVSSSIRVQASNSELNARPWLTLHRSAEELIEEQSQPDHRPSSLDLVSISDERLT